MSSPSGLNNNRVCREKRGCLGAGSTAVVLRGNYDPSSLPGILIHNPCRDDECDSQVEDASRRWPCRWIISEEPFSPEDFGLDPDDSDLVNRLPDMSIDPETNLFTVINASALATRSYFVTFTYPTVPVSGDGRELVPGGGETVTETGEKQRVVTVLLVLEPYTCADVCFLEDRSRPSGKKKGRRRGPRQWQVTSDVKDVKRHISTDEIDVTRCYPFPLGGKGPYLCSQGFNGKFTHFYPGTYHAVDFQCPVGTPVLSLGRGRIHSVRHSETASGIHVSNLFIYNSVMVAQDDGLFVEYVHIACKSCPLAVGDAVEAGDRIADSGDVGFCPVPHLHIQAHASADDAAETVPWVLSGRDGQAYVPVAGRWYDADGPLDPPIEAGIFPSIS